MTTIASHVEFCVGDLIREVSRVDRKEEATAQLAHHPTFPYGEKAAGPDRQPVTCAGRLLLSDISAQKRPVSTSSCEQW